ncbi:hypothetical protein M408DRAFT_240780 [Serendipita vermifera MAFF 305830]|uniref:Transcription initiation factor IIA subunit 2 n=1 Tax=Serendipita vermifera MAFF 305830 TaxID=933852 RepID=A0A0C2XSK3_SERVB|nr:hypothetical protein M408DRAFT_240780 [Serendipita vermifera MAFF 305830]
MAHNWEFYRFSTIGLALLDTVDEMVRDGSLSGDIANIIMSRFDDALGNTLSQKVDAKCSFTAHCSTFNLVDEVYRFTLKNVRFKMEGAEIVTVPTMKIISVKSTNTEEAVPLSQTAMKNAKKAAAEAKPLAQRDSPAPQKGKGKSKKKAG